ncbi:MAG: protein BatD [Bacteroidaceae bacterium]|nr:protein BatD [Bacteroidaceae bacterium]
MRKIILLLLFITTTFTSWANDKITFTAAAPEVVVSGDQFRLTFTVNSQKVRDFRAPSIKGFEVLMGPSRSTQSSTQIINGNVTSTSTITFTYILMAEKEGTYSIPGATIVADGNNYTSNSVSIKVLPPDQSAGQSNGRGGVSSARNQANAGKITDKELFITATASKSKVYEQEAILLTYKIYTQVNLTQLHGDMPDLKGFHTQEVELPSQKQWSLEHYNGKNYNTTVYSQYVLFPQQSGKLEIPSITFEGTISQLVASDDPFDAFFNGGSNYINIKKNIVTPKLTIDVKELPAGKPANFSGGVGEFTLSSSISTQELKTNDAVTIKLVISGTGNMKLINTPEVGFPQDFEIYDPKVDNKFNLTREGLTGTKVIEYLAIPRHAGTYTIPAIEFSYFDLKSQAYKTLKTDSYTLNVAKGEGNADQVIANFTSKEDLKVLGKDIRYIKTGNTHLTEKGKYFFGSTSYYVWYIIPLALFIGFMIIYRKQAMENANVAKVRTKKANKVATKRMKNAGKLLAEKKTEAFYDEVLKAMWGYISDKLNIPVSQLSKDNIEEELNKYGVSEDLIKAFISTLNECEFARYAPGNQNEAMDKVYSSAIDIISKMENCIKR